MSLVKKLQGRINEDDPLPRSAAHGARSALEGLRNSLQSIRTDDEEINKGLKELIAKVDAKISGVTSSPKAASGQVLVTPQQLKGIVTRSTGLSNWKIGTDDDEKDRAIEQVQSTYDITVDPKTAKYVTLTRSTDDRSELFYFSFLIFPGGVYMDNWATDRVSGSGEVYPTVRSLENHLARI